MNYRDYQSARDAAWEILLDCKIDRLPVNLNIVCKALGVRTASYQAANALIHRRNLTRIAAQSDGLSCFAEGTPLVLYNGACIPERIRFTIGHELGHIVLGHVSRWSVTTMNREPSPRDNPRETAANQFAARLLAPACVLWGLEAHTAEEISRICHISKQAAEFRANRMSILYTRNKFLSSPLERRLYQQFLPFIKESAHHRGARPDK